MECPLTPIAFKERAERLYPEKLAVVCGDDRLTYREFGERANRLAHLLMDLGLRPRDRTAFLSTNCHRLLEAYYGVVQAGGILVPLNIRLRPEDFAFILNDCEVKILCLEREFLPAIDRIREQVPSLGHVLILDGDRDAGDARAYEPLLARMPGAPPPPPPLDDRDTAEIFYTSGTTGRPKGVMLSHRNLYLHAFSAQAALQYRDDDIQLHTIPLFHVNGWGTPQFLTLAGGTHVILKKFDPARVYDLVRRERVTRFFLVPTMATALLNHPWAEGDPIETMRLILVGGSAPHPGLIRRLEERFRCACYGGYGLSETTPVLTLAIPKAHLRSADPSDRAIRQAMTGVEVPGVHVRVVDEEGRNVPRDGKHVGEIVVQSNVVMAGYWNRPEETAAVIRDGWFHTGDMAVWDAENYLLIVDRQKDLIISGGENISSVEIEKVLYLHPAVLECAVVAVPDDRWGEVPKALVVLKEGARATAEEILAHCGGHLAGFKVPKSVEFVESLPKSGTGKVLKREIRERYWAGRSRRVN